MPALPDDSYLYQSLYFGITCLYVCTSKISWHKFLSVKSVSFSNAPSTTDLSSKKPDRAVASSDIRYDQSNDKIDDAYNSGLWICTESTERSSILLVWLLSRLHSCC
jgi:hypothetical protein